MSLHGFDGRVQLFGETGCYFANMKTFLKVILIAALLVVAIKLSPMIFLGALLGLIAAAVLGALGISLLAGLLAVATALVMALAPIWIPILVIMGVISLFRKNGDSAPPSTPTPVVTA
jgi:hypothetical protein